MYKIQQNCLKKEFEKYQQEFEKKALEVLNSGCYILGDEVLNFEKEFADFLSVRYCVGVASGSDALWIAFKLLGIGKGDEVLVQANAYFASITGITANGGTPVFVEPDEYYQIDVSKLEEKVTKNTKAVLVVHLYGHTAKMDDILSFCKKHNLYLIEDCAQSHGAEYNGQMLGTFGDVGCFSFYPSKNLGAFGDAGAIVTNNQQLAQNFKIFRNYGSEKRYHHKIIGTNSRLDELQAGLLRVRLKHLNEINTQRCSIAARYNKEIHNDKLILPKERPCSKSVWHQYVIRSDKRNELMEYLSRGGIDTLIHYPIPPYLSEAYSYLGHKSGDYPITEKYSSEVLSIPIYSELTNDEQSYIIKLLNEF